MEAGGVSRRRKLKKMRRERAERIEGLRLDRARGKESHREVYTCPVDVGRKGKSGWHWGGASTIGEQPMIHQIQTRGPGHHILDVTMSILGPDGDGGGFFQVLWVMGGGGKPCRARGGQKGRGIGRARTRGRARNAVRGVPRLFSAFPLPASPFFSVTSSPSSSGSSSPSIPSCPQMLPSTAYRSEADSERRRWTAFSRLLIWVPVGSKSWPWTAGGISCLFVFTASIRRV